MANRKPSAPPPKPRAFSLDPDDIPCVDTVRANEFDDALALIDSARVYTGLDGEEPDLAAVRHKLLDATDLLRALMKRCEEVDKETDVLLEYTGKVLEIAAESSIADRLRTLCETLGASDLAIRAATVECWGEVTDPTLALKAFPS